MANTLCCLNPSCPQPHNPNNNKFYQNCGQTMAILRNRYRPVTLLSDEE